MSLYARRRYTRRIVVHCSATPEGRHTTVADITLWHRQRGFTGIGYHFVIYLDGTVHEGRPIHTVGAHAAGFNSYSISICYVGGVDADNVRIAKDTRTPAQKEALRDLLNQLLEAYPTITEIVGHRDLPGVRKACPCFDARKEYAPLFSKEAPKAEDEGTYTVVRGDTLWAIGRKFKMEVPDIIKLNGLDTSTLQVGQKLRVKS